MFESIANFFSDYIQDIVEYAIATLVVIGFAAAMVGWFILTYIAWS